MELFILVLNKRFSLQTDGSDIGIGEILKQGGRPVAYISRLMKGSELRYSVTEKELLGSLWSWRNWDFI